MATKGSCLTEKDKIKFNLQDTKRLAKLNSKTVEENKKKMMRKNLMINTQVNPNHEEKAKLDNYGNIQSTVRIHINSGPENPYTNSPKNTLKRQMIDFGSSLNGSFASLKSKEKQTSINYKPLIKLDRNKSKLKSNSILKQVSMSLDDSLSKGLTGFGITSFNNKESAKIEKRSNSIRANSNSRTSSKVFNCDSSSILLRTSPIKQKNSCFTTKEENKPSLIFKSDGTINYSLPGLKGNTPVSNSKASGSLLVNLSQTSKISNNTTGSNAIRAYQFDEDLPKKRLTIQTGAEFSSRGLKSLNFKNFTPSSNTKSIIKMSRNSSMLMDTSIMSQIHCKVETHIRGKEQQHKEGLETKNRKKPSTTSNIIITQETPWSYYVDKYLKYLFTGKVIKFKEAVVVKEEIINNGIIGYSCNVNRGIVRNYNEDRIVTILSLPKPKSKIMDDSSWPSVSFFAIYDGHGGTSVSEWLSENLHYYIINQSSFPKDPKTAIFQGFKEAEETLLVKLMNCTLNIKAKQKQSALDGNSKKHDSSGSCAIVVLIINKECYVANLGDSRGLLSCDNISRCYTLTNDHKPDDPIEKKRIEENGGRLWKQDNSPYRVIPGGLSVSLYLY